MAADLMTSSKKLTPDIEDVSVLASEISFSYASIFMAGGAMAIVAPDLRIVQANPAFSELYGVSREILIGRALLECIAEADREKFLAQLTSLVPESGARSSTMVFRFINAQGKPLYVSALLGLLPQALGYQLSLTDVTKEKFAEYRLQQRLRELQAHSAECDRKFKVVEHIKQEWERIIDCVDDMVIFTDERGCIKRCNKSLMKQLGLAFSDLIGQPLDQLLAGFDIVPDADGQSNNLYHRQAQRWFHVKTYPLVESGEQVSGTVVALRDFTEMKLLNQKIAAKGIELEKANWELKETQSKVLHQEKMASVGQLAAGVAHEINNPMGFISSNLSTLEKYLGRLKTYIGLQEELLHAQGSADSVAALAHRRKELKIDHVCSDSVDLIRESMDGADRVKNIVQNLKSFSRVDCVQLSDANINECLDSTISMVWNEIKYKATLERDYGDLPALRCYPQQLNQVFLNLIVNAGQAISTQGVIQIRTWLAEGTVLVSVADNGCGIPADKLGRIFEPFFTTKEVGKGTGLGLSISYDIVKKHGGEILVESEVGRGTTFTVKLPLAGRAERCAEGANVT